MDSSGEQYIELALEGRSAREVTEEIGLEPTRPGPRGDPNCWVFTVPTSRDQFKAEAHFNELFAALDPVWEKLVAAAKKCPTVVLVWVIESTVEGWTPSTHMDANVIAKLAELGAEVDIDIYCNRDYVGPEEEGECLNPAFAHPSTF